MILRGGSDSEDVLIKLLSKHGWSGKTLKGDTKKFKIE